MRKAVPGDGFHQPEGVESAESSGIRYPGFGKLLLVWSAIGVLTAVRYLLPFGHFGPGAGKDFLPTLVGSVIFYCPWAILTRLVFSLERKFPLGSPGWPIRALLLAAISVPFCLAISPIMSALYFAPGWVLGTMPQGVRFRFFSFIHFPVAEINFWLSVGAGYFLRTPGSRR